MATDDHGYWNATAQTPSFPALESSIEVDVAVVGAGIVGVTAARRLKDLGLTVAVVEARRIGRQVTGKSTAKVTSQHGLVYSKLARKFDDDYATRYGAVQQAGLRAIREFVTRFAIDCDLETVPAFAYTVEDARVDALDREQALARRFGLPASLTTDTGLPFAVRAAVRFDEQAQFHPVKYLAGLATTIPGDGSHVFEHSRVIEWDPSTVKTGRGEVRARHVMMATHLPLGQLGLYYARAYPHAEPVIAAPIGRFPDGMYISADQPTHSIRAHKGADGTLYGVATGPRFKPGHVDDERDAFREIERWLAAHFDAGAVTHRWVNEDYVPMGDTPFIGWSSSSEGYLVATGFDAWGITNGTSAGFILGDLAAGRDNDAADLFDASRVRPVKGAGKFVSENAQVAAHLASGYLSRKLQSLADLPPGEAAILKLDGDQVAAFRDDDGRVHAVAAACTHMGCLVGWNETDRTWDCACHGSRFGLDGSVLHGPAVKPLARRPS